MSVSCPTFQNKLEHHEHQLPDVAQTKPDWVCLWNLGQLMLMMLGVVFEIAGRCGS